MFEFLARAASQFWVAEKDDQIIGYARSIQFNGLQELTEFFISPGQQSSGIGRELLSRAFPEADGGYRTIVATLDERALYRYLKSGVYARFPIKYFYRPAEKVVVDSELVFEPMQHAIEEAVALGKKILLLGEAPNKIPRIFDNPCAGQSGYRNSQEYHALCDLLWKEMHYETA